MGEPAYLVSRSRLILMFVGFVVVLISVSLMVAYVPDHSCPSDVTQKNAITKTHMDINYDHPVVIATDLPPQGDGPWMEPFLNPSIRPIHYDLYLDPDFYFDGNTFIGRENITIYVGVNTQHIIVHYKFLNVTTLQVTTAEGNNLVVTDTFAYDANEYWVTSLADEVPSGSVIVLSLEFSGSLVNGIVGYYKSTYVNQDTGIERYIFIILFTF